MFNQFPAAVERIALDLEDRGRRDNLIIYGVPEIEEETNDLLYTAMVTNVFKQIIYVNVKSIERLHRLARGGGTAQDQT